MGRGRGCPKSEIREFFSAIWGGEKITKTLTKFGRVWRISVVAKTFGIFRNSISAQSQRDQETPIFPESSKPLARAFWAWALSLTLAVPLGLAFLPIGIGLGLAATSRVAIDHVNDATLGSNNHRLILGATGRSAREE